MKLKKIISGAQTGADSAGLVCAKRAGLLTGGTAPLGFRTEAGPNPEFAALYGVKEHSSPEYKPRTWANVKDADATVWIGTTTSPGFYCTRNACKAFLRELFVNPTTLAEIAEHYETLNWAGNRFSKNPEVVSLTENLFHTLPTKETEA